jgi:hypothetical protein
MGIGLKVGFLEQCKLPYATKVSGSIEQLESLIGQTMLIPTPSRLTFRTSEKVNRFEFTWTMYTVHGYLLYSSRACSPGNAEYLEVLLNTPSAKRFIGGDGLLRPCIEKFDHHGIA